MELGLDWDRIIELKTAGLASGYGIPHGWDDDGLPLGYEIQARWQMHVMDAATVEVVGLVAGLGVVHRTVHRDLDIELDLVAQVEAWWQRFVLGGEEPPFEVADKDTVAYLFPTPDGESVDLDHTDAPSLLARRRGTAKAQVALGNTQLKVYHALLSRPGTRYEDLGPDYYERQRDTRRQIAHHVGKLGALGFDVTLCRIPGSDPGPEADHAA